MTEFQEGFNRIAECTSLAVSSIRSSVGDSILYMPPFLSFTRFPSDDSFCSWEEDLFIYRV